MTDHRPPHQLPIAVVGVSSLMPGSVDVEGFWRDIIEGRDLMTDVPPTHWLVEDYYDPDPAAQGKTYARRGAFLPDIEFDSAAFGLPPSILPVTDTSQLLALIAAQRVLADVTGGTPDKRDRVSVILGATALTLVGEMSMASGRPHWLKGLRESGIAEPEAQQICDRIAANYVPWQQNTFPGLLSNVVAGRIANRFDLKGTNCTVDAACASALAALSVAVGELTLGTADMVITGGVDTLNDHTTYQCFSKTNALSPTGDCRPFSDKADGTMLGEGVAMFALKRLADAEQDGNRIYAVICGVGSSSDGRAAAIYAPLAEGQVEALRRAYNAAGYSPDTVELVEAHGTGTAAGDLAEVSALRQVFSVNGLGRQRCALGSVKSQIGHTKACAGAAGLLKAVLAVQHKVLPPTIKIDRPNPKLDLDDSPFYLNTSARPWVHRAPYPRRASVSAFGFGGTNFHVTLEEYRPKSQKSSALAWRVRSAPAELVLLSADCPAALSAIIRELKPDRPIASLAHETQQSFQSTDLARLAVVASSTTELAEKLALAQTMIGDAPQESRPLPGVYYCAGSDDSGRIAFLFPGQGAQYVGMSSDLTMHFPAAQAVWDRVGCMDFTESVLADVVFPPPARTDAERDAQQARLTATEWAQPALAGHSLVLLGLLQAVNLQPDALAGHSAGELTALHAGGTFDADALMGLARRRGELIRDAAAPGAMLAVSAGSKTVAAVIDCVTDAWIVNYNTSNQVVLSGTSDAIASVERKLMAEGVTTRRLRTATAFHSPLVAAATEPLLEFLSGIAINPPTIEVYGNADAVPYPTNPAEIRRRIAKQLASPVRFADQIERMYDDGVRTFVEVGAGATLTTLIGQILAEREHCAVNTDRHGRNGVRSFFEALGALAVRGISLDLASLWEHCAPFDARQAERTAVKRPGMTVKINGTSYGRPYPPPGGAAELPPPNPAVSAEQPVPVLNSAEDPRADAEWASLFQEIQRQTAEAQAMYQRTTAEAHAAYLRTTEASLAAMTKLLGFDAPSAATAGSAPTTRPPELLSGQSYADQPATSVMEPPPSSASSNGQRSAEPAARQEVPADLEAVLLSVVADKTGYPVEVLNPGMDMEADLGIDSIKRVQILAAMREHIPGLEETGPDELAQLGTLRTLDDVVGRLREFNSIGAVPDAAASLARNTESCPGGLTRLTIQTAAAPSTGLAMPGLGSGPVAITEDGTGVAPLLVHKLAEHGIAAEVVSTVPPDCDRVVFLGGLRDISSVQDAFATQREAFRVARVVAPHLTTHEGLFVTVQRTGGDFGLSGADPMRAWLSGLAALSRTVDQEWPRTSVKAIDCDLQGPDAMASAIADELTSGGSEVNVGLRVDGRITLRAVETPCARVSDMRLDSGAVIVASGGARGITATALCALAKKYQLRLLLLGRTPLDRHPAMNGADSEVHDTLVALQHAGAQVCYRSLDIRDSDAVAAAVAEVRREWGPITGIVHGAGVLADRLVADKTDKQFDDVFTTKVEGLRSLLNATVSDPLRSICMFSSVVGHYGNPGQCDYAMANAVLAGVAAAEAAKRPDCLVRSIGWGPWAGGMVTAPIAELFRARGIPLIPVDDGTQAFVTEFAGARDEVNVILAATDAMGHLPFDISDAAVRYGRHG